MDLLSHAEDSDDPLSGFVATSPDYNVACGFGNNVYVINPPPNAIDVNATLGSLSPNPWENEIAIPGPVSGSQIRALTLPGQGISILNPGYIP